jgi:hypothetical protein
MIDKVSTKILFYVEFVGIYHNKDFYIPRSNGTSAGNKQKDKYRFHTVAILLFYIPQNGDLKQ